MSLLFTIVYAAHANGTHHKLALDALRHLKRSDAELWRRVFLSHAEVYLAGSKAPDVEFRDFKNHVLHVRDGFWGGAPEKAAAWYGHLSDALREKDFERAVYAAGVLSHYVTDPVQPFHTAQSEAETNVHRAVEWSISRAYDTLRALGEAHEHHEPFALPEGPDWLKAQVIAGAERANPAYETLITHYDLHTGVVDPPEGLDVLAREAVAGLLIYAAQSFAAVLDRALTESGAEPPPVSLTAETLIATLKIPAKWVTKKITDGEARRQVQAMYDELMATGRVETTLPEDDRVVRDLHQREVVAPREAKLAEERARRLASPPSAPTSDRTARPEKPAALAGRRHDFKTKAAEPASSQTPVVVPAAPSRSGLASLSKAEPRCYLLESDDLERAPSIGPKLAERLAAGGLAKVADFLAADPSATIALLGDSRFDEDMIERWKKEARLVLRVPGLRGTHAQLLVGAGFETAESLAMADPMTVSSALLAYATTPGGARILRNGDAPDVEAVTRWVQCAQHALAA